MLDCTFDFEVFIKVRGTVGSLIIHEFFCFFYISYYTYYILKTMKVYCQQFSSQLLLIGNRC